MVHAEAAEIGKMDAPAPPFTILNAAAAARDAMLFPTACLCAVFPRSERLIPCHLILPVISFSRHASGSSAFKGWVLLTETEQNPSEGTYWLCFCFCYTFKWRKVKVKKAREKVAHILQSQEDKVPSLGCWGSQKTNGSSGVEGGGCSCLHHSSCLIKKMNR